MFLLSAVLVKRVFCFVLEFCSVTRRWIMHSFPFFFRHRLNTWVLCRAGVPAWLCCSSSCCSHRREKTAELSSLRRQKIAISHRCALRASQVGCGLIWNLRGGAEWPGVWSERGSNYVSQLRAGFSSGTLTKLSGFQFDSDVLNLGWAGCPSVNVGTVFVSFDKLTCLTPANCDLEEGSFAKSERPEEESC